MRTPCHRISAAANQPRPVVRAAVDAGLSRLCRRLQPVDRQYFGFGSYVGTRVPTTSSASFSCSKTTPGNTPERVDYTVSLSTGAGSYAQRRMTRTALPADILPYNLYLNLLPAVLNTSVWGDGIATGTTVR